jgi:hypothetical protein
MTPHAAPPVAQPLAPLSAGADAGQRSGALEHRLQWAGLLLCFALIPAFFCAFEAMPFQDLPAHAGLIALRHRYAASAFDQEFLVLAPHIGPYSLFRFLGEQLMRVVGPLGAVRVLAMLPLFATPAALLYMRRTLFGDRSPLYGYVGLLTTFGLMTLLGFASYQLGVAVMLVALTLWLRLLESADLGLTARGREVAVVVAAPLVFVAHGHAFLLFLALAGIAAFVGPARKLRLLRLRALVPALLLAAYVARAQRGSVVPEGSAPLNIPMTPTFQGLADKLSLLLTTTLMTRSGVDLLVGVLLWTFGLFVALRTLQRFRRSQVSHPADHHRRALLIGGGALLGVFLILPHSVGWFGYVDGRLVPIILMLLLLGADLDAIGAGLRQTAERAVPLGALAVCLVALIAQSRFQREAEGYKEVLAKVPAKASLLNLPLDPNSDVFAAHPFVHYDKLVLTDRDIVVSDMWFHQGSALYPTPKNPALRLPDDYSESNLKSIVWAGYQLKDWDYVLIRTRPGAAQPAIPAALTLHEHRGGWWLFKRL